MGKGRNRNWLFCESENWRERDSWSNGDRARGDTTLVWPDSSIQYVSRRGAVCRLKMKADFPTANGSGRWSNVPMTIFQQRALRGVDEHDDHCTAKVKPS